MLIDDESEHPSVVSCFIYKLQIQNNIVKIKYIVPINIAEWLAEKNGIGNWSYNKVKHKTDKAYLLDNRWIPKSQMEIGVKIREGDDMYYGHRANIRELEKNEEIV
jgi:hypothetical protein